MCYFKRKKEKEFRSNFHTNNCGEGQRNAVVKSIQPTQGPAPSPPPGSGANMVTYRAEKTLRVQYTGSHHCPKLTVIPIKQGLKTLGENKQQPFARSRGHQLAGLVGIRRHPEGSEVKRFWYPNKMKLF